MTSVTVWLYYIQKINLRRRFKIIHFIFDKQLKESSVEEVVTDKDEIYLDLLVDCIDYHQSFFNQSQSTSKYSQKSVQVHVCWP